MARIIPPKTVRIEFLLLYELKGAQKAVDALARHYGIRTMKIVLDGRKVGRKYIAVYCDNTAYFKRRGLRKQVVLHEFYHHLVKEGLTDPTNEEREADAYASTFLKRF